VPRRPRLTKADYIRLAITNKGTQMEKHWTDLYLHQNEPIQMPYGAGAILIDANDSCIQEYVGPN
jgi:hypothetical protein